jgi:hypothetical protein
MLGALAAIVAATFVVAGSAYAESTPERSDYVAKVEPICQSNTEDNTRILKGVRDKVKQGKLAVAGGQFINASNTFGVSVGEIIAVPRPAADDARLQKWFKYLRIVQTNLRMVGKALKEGNKVKALHETIRAERSGNAANNVSFIFNFHYCRLTPSRFR